MLIHFSTFCTADVQLISYFPTSHPKKKSGLTATILFTMFSYKVIQEPALIRLRVQIIHIVQVTPEVDHFLRPLASWRVLFAHSLFFSYFLAHSFVI